MHGVVLRRYWLCPCGHENDYICAGDGVEVVADDKLSESEGELQPGDSIVCGKCGEKFEVVPDKETEINLKNLSE